MQDSESPSKRQVIIWFGLYLTSAKSISRIRYFKEKYRHFKVKLDVSALCYRFTPHWRLCVCRQSCALRVHLYRLSFLETRHFLLHEKDLIKVWVRPAGPEDMSDDGVVGYQTNWLSVTGQAGNSLQVSVETEHLKNSAGLFLLTSTRAAFLCQHWCLLIEFFLLSIKISSHVCG